MIPKVIHYCWFGKGLMPQSQKDCIKSWRKYCPDYKIICWDESNFDVNFCPYTAEAYKLKKWAFVADVARLKALVEMGGVYMDTDVELFSSLDSFLNQSAFTGIEIYNKEFEQEGKPLLDENNRPKTPGTGIPYCGFLSAVMGSEPNNPIFEECLDKYKHREPYRADGSINSAVIDGLLAGIAVKYGFRYQDGHQELGIIHIYPSSVFPYAGVPRLPESVAYHYTAWSWMPKTRKQRLFLFLDKIMVLKPYRTIKKKIKGLWSRS